MSEFDFIDQLRRQTESRKLSPRLIKGIGDDASVIRQAANRDLVVTTDLLIENIDFIRDATPARLLGHKALAVSLSDIAAMGGRPCWSFLSIGMPREIWSASFKDEFMAGFFALADRFGVTLAGGDVSETKQEVVVDFVVLGEVASGRAVLRSGARVGDQIYVTGNLGGAAAGLKLVKLGARVSEPGAVATGSSGTSIVSESFSSEASRATGSSDARDEQAIQSLLLRQLQPEPRVGWGIVLGEEHLATSMIDLSDGLSSDLHHLCRESKVGALIEASSIPLDEDVRHLCGRRALDPLALALHGGEDFELLFTVAPENASRLPKRVDGVAVSRIGEITSDLRSVRVREKNHEWHLSPTGFQHFST
jgi:thiamine-monophosphate kinase